jgi:hypothetical protein
MKVKISDRIYENPEKVSLRPGTRNWNQEWAESKNWIPSDSLMEVVSHHNGQAVHQIE